MLREGGDGGYTRKAADGLCSGDAARSPLQPTDRVGGHGIYSALMRRVLEESGALFAVDEFLFISNNIPQTEEVGIWNPCAFEINRCFFTAILDGNATSGLTSGNAA